MGNNTVRILAFGVMGNFSSLVTNQAQQHTRRRTSTMDCLQTMVCFRRMAEKNAQGILLTQKGEYCHAAVTFEEGFGVLLSHCLAAYAPMLNPTLMIPITPQHPSLNIYEVFRRLHPAQENSRVVYSVSLPWSGTRNVESNNDVFQLFDRPLHLNPNQEDTLPKCRFYCNTLSAILHFNKGLVYHFYGLETGKSQFLATALEFYLLSYETIGTCLEEEKEETSSAVSLLLLATCNNIAHIYANFRRLEETRVYNDELNALLLASLACSMAGFSGSISEEEYDVFFMNVSFFQKSQLVSAPAA